MSVAYTAVVMTDCPDAFACAELQVGSYCMYNIYCMYLISDNGQNSRQAAAAKLVHLLLEADEPAVQAQHGHASCHGM